jgi:hypothetical protein
MFILKNRLMEEGEDGGGEGPTLEQLQAQVAAAEAEKAAMASKMDELLGEAKKAKAAKRDEEAARLAAEQAAAAEKGDFEQLHKSAMAELEKERAAHKELVSSIGQEKRNNAAMKIATDLADGPNADLLSEFIAKRLKYTDGGVKVTDENGELTVSTVDELKTTFKNDPRYTALLKGNQSSGGGATGGSNSGGAAKTLTRAEFEALNPIAAAKFMKEGGQLT